MTTVVKRFLIAVAFAAVAVGAFLSPRAVDALSVWDTGPQKPPLIQYVAPSAFTTNTTDGTYSYVTGTLITLSNVQGHSVDYRCAAATSSADLKVQGSLDSSTWDDLVMLDEAGAAQSAARVAIAASGNDTFRIVGNSITAVDSANSVYRYLRVVARRTLDGGAHSSVTCVGYAK